MSLTISDSQVFSPALLPRPLNLITVTALSELSCNLNTLDILLTGGFIDTLETLTISDRSGICMRSLLRVLPKVPSVHKFKVCSEPFTEGPEALPQDFSTLLPNLRSLTCYHAFLALLAPSRPLVSLNVLDEYSPPLNLSAILRSYGPNATSLGITCLYIPSNIYLTAGGFPHLRKLVVEFPSAWYIARFELGIRGPKTTAGLMKFIIDACDKWAGNPSIQQLRIAIEPGFDPMDLDLAIQHAALSGSLLQKFPALRWFQLGDRIEWERLAVDEAWRVFVPINKRAHIVEQFEAGGPHVRDHDGYLRRLNASNLL
ncbi:hypothetical protein BD779DRAFT_1667112 [Infundibulicybe gibba]|nr:hypothetical protein BD779DRAFT_1667112 [Infundibulicybe gibba]